MQISIIIPVYNGADTICNALDSIFDQKRACDVEVIVIDDCSTDSTHYVLENYPPQKSCNSLRIIRLPGNSRQGAARNIGIENATGRFIQFLDADDILTENSLENLLAYISNDNGISDILFFDSQTYDLHSSTEVSCLSFRNNTTKPLSGEEYLSTCQVPWTPWLALYRRDYLIENKIKFVENVRFEDSDFVLKAVLLAKKVRYAPIIVYKYFINGQSTTNIGNDANKIEERLKSAIRLRNLGLEFKQLYPRGSNVILGHYQFKYKAILCRNLWRLSFKEMTALLRRYPYELPTQSHIIQVAKLSPELFAVVGVLMKPVLRSALKLRTLINRYRKK